MTWQPPSKNTPLLYVPLSDGNATKPIESCHHSTDHCIRVTAKFLQLWETPDISSDAKICQTLVQLLETFGTLIKSGKNSLKSFEKTSPHDVVTDMDIGVELLLRFWFSKHLPHHKIIGEEAHHPLVTVDDVIWYLDPIDGTANYAKGKSNYCLNLGSSYKGKPYINIVYLPETNHYYYAHPKSTSYHFKAPKTNIICSEFLPHRTQEQAHLNTLQERTQSQIHQTQALGVSLTHMIEGKVKYFYKPNVKPWDVLAPIGILSSTNYWDIELVTYNNKKVSLFSNAKWFLDYLNNCFQDNCRIGLITVTPSSEPEIKSLIQSTLLSP